MKPKEEKDANKNRMFSVTFVHEHTRFQTVISVDKIQWTNPITDESFADGWKTTQHYGGWGTKWNAPSQMVLDIHNSAAKLIALNSEITNGDDTLAENYADFIVNRAGEMLMHEVTQ